MASLAAFEILVIANGYPRLRGRVGFGSQHADRMGRCEYPCDVKLVITLRVGAFVTIPTQ